MKVLHVVAVALLLLAPGARMATAGVQGAPAPVAQSIPWDAAIQVASPVAPTFVLVQYGTTVGVFSSLPALADEPTVVQVSWTCGGCTVTVIVPKKDSEDTGSWKRRVKATVDAAKELVPPDPGTGS